MTDPAAPDAADPAVAQPVRVWDLPVRLFHWALVGLFAFSWWSGENHEMDWHRQSGLLILALLLFRLFWGLAGSRTARFAQFVKGPRKVLAYVPKAAAGQAGDGHSPLGGWSVIALLAVLLTLVGAGLFAVDVDGLESGPLAEYLSFDGGRAAAELHELAFNAALALIALHICAIAFYQIVARQNLIIPMLTGKRQRAPEETVEDVRWSKLRALVGLAVILVLVWAVAQGFHFASAGEV